MAIGNLLHRFTICVLCCSRIFWTVTGDFLSSVKLTQTSKHNNQKLTELPDRILESLSEEPQGNVIMLDFEEKFQEILGFGGAFTEAAALNFFKLSAEERQNVINLYFGDPSNGGHGYTIGRVHINSCDFSPGSYSFDDVTNDTSLDDFDTNVTHDSEQMIPLIKLALERARSDGRDIRIFASPWSPPAWMKVPNPKLPADEAQSMLSSASPNGLLPEFQEVWAAYISKFIDAYARKGIEMWGMTVQNEPEYAADWEACKYTAEYTRDFVKNFLGPKMEADHPELKIMVFDHNKDHVHKWAEVVYADPEAAKYIDGLAVHWYAGDFFDHMEQAHQTAPDKFLLGSEACNCPGVSEGDQSWERAENLAHDILGDLNSWAVAWTDWNLLLDAQGGPNHEGNDCDANVIADPEEILGRGTVVLQPSYYYMGHLSRFIPPGSRRIFTDIQFEIPEKDLPAGELEKTEQLGMYHCDGGSRQLWEFSNGMFKLKGTDLCIDVPNGSVKSGEALQVYTCNPDNINQHFSLLAVDGEAEQITTNISQRTQCVDILGIHLSEGSRVQQWECSSVNRTENQLWIYNSSDFTLRTAMHPKWCLTAGDRALLTVAGFNTDPLSDQVAVVVLNRGDVDTSFSLFDPKAGHGVTDLLIPAHSIQTYCFSKTQENVQVTSVAQPPPPWNVSPNEDPPFVTMTRVIVASFFGMLVVGSAVYVMKNAKLQDGGAPKAVSMERLPRQASWGEVDDEASVGFVLEDEDSPSRDHDVRMQMLVNGAVESSSGIEKQPTRPSGKNC